MKNLTDITLILDRSGSMHTCLTDTIEAYNRFVSDQQKEPGECIFSLVKFDHEYELTHAGKPIADIPMLTLESYVPRGSTALLDAIGKTINATGARLHNTPEDQRPSNVLVVILTDGQENASLEFDRVKIKSMIEHQTSKYDWHFVFLAANQDAVLTASGYGISSSSSMSYSSVSGPKGASGPSGTRCAVAALNAGVKNYRNTKGLSKADFFAGTQSLQAGDNLDDQTISPISDSTVKSPAVTATP